MRTAVRRVAALVVVAHGLVHLLGALDGSGLARVGPLNEPIPTWAAPAWLAAALLAVAAGIGLARAAPRWWVLGAAAAAVSQVVILSSWADSAGMSGTGRLVAGTAANVVLGLAVIHGWAVEGRPGLRSAYRRAATRAEAQVCPPVALAPVPLRREDLASLPAPVAAYLEATGAVGQPPVAGFRARIRGRIRSGPDRPWMSFTGEQVNTFGPDPTRLFRLDATMAGVPVDVFHHYRGGRATMDVRLAGLMPMARAGGPEMDRAETVTVFNDLCVMAPAALVGAPVTWEEIDQHRVRGTLRVGTHRASAELVFDDDHLLVDFISDDRLRAPGRGRPLVAERWSTPLDRYRPFGARRIASRGRGRWHPPAPGAAFDYLEIEMDDVTWFPAVAPPASRLPAAEPSARPAWRRAYRRMSA